MARRRASSSTRRKTWKKGKVFTKGRKRVRYIYPDGKKKGRKLVDVGRPAVSRRSRAPRSGRRGR